jgi:hypothetical protein
MAIVAACNNKLGEVFGGAIDTLYTDRKFHI